MVSSHKMRFAQALVAVVGLASGLAVVATGCGDDDDGGAPAPTADATTDTGVDSTVADTADTAAPADTRADVRPDAPTSAKGFPRFVVKTYCERLGDCCGVTAFDLDACITYYDVVKPLGGVFGLSEWTPALDKGNVDFDPVSAAQCVTDITSFNCAEVGSDAYSRAQRSCTAALVGKLAIGASGCSLSVECVTGAYCDKASADAGTGTCKALGMVDQPCKDTTYSVDCTYLGNGTPANYCKPGTGDGGTATCQPSEATGVACKVNADCKGLLCFDTCEEKYTFSDPGVADGICAFFGFKDAGADAAPETPADGADGGG